MPNYEFEKSEHEQMANRMFSIRVVFVVCACLGMSGPMLLLAGGAAVAGLDGDTWVSVPILDVKDISELTNPFVCQTPKGGPCPDGEVESHSGRYCFKFHKDHMTYMAAANKCLEASILASFARIHSKEDNAKVHKFCKDDSPCWIGLTRSLGSAEYSWADGTKLTYTNWTDGHPHPIESNPDLGSYSVIGYKRWAGSALVLGTLSIVFFSIQIVILLAMCWVMHKALTDKNATCICILASCDGVQALFLFVILLLACMAAGSAKGAAVGGALLSVLFSLVELALVAYLAYAGCQIKSGMEEQIKTTATE